MQILGLFCHVIDTVKGITVTKNINKINLERAWGQLQSKKFLETITHKISETNSSFHVK